MKIHIRNQDGWTTMEYVVGALIIITIVTTVIGLVRDGLKTQADKVVNQMNSAN